MVSEEEIKRVIKYLQDFGDSEAEEEMRWALKWVLTGVIPDSTPVVIQSALNQEDDAEPSTGDLPGEID